MRSFKKTYTTFIEIGSISTSDSFFDDEAGQFEKTGELYADVQPYNGGLAEKEYGQVGEVSMRIFCEPNRDLLDVGNIAKIGNEYYTVTYSEHWESGSMALLKKRM